MELTKLYGIPCYPIGYELFIRKKTGDGNQTVHLRTVKQIKDGDSCYGCYLESACNKYKKLSPIGKFCMNTIFQICNQ